MRAEDNSYILTCTKRSQQEQDADFAIGRTAPGVIITWTTCSRHLTGDAWDFVIEVNGKPDWHMNYKDKWDRAIAIGKSLGLTQVVNHAGKVMEYGHLQRMT